MMGKSRGLLGRLSGVGRAVGFAAITVGLLAGCAPSSDDSDSSIPGSPLVIGVSPSVGIVSGGTHAEVETSGFATSFASALPSIDFGGQPGQVVGFLTADAVAVRTPPSGSPGVVDVVVTSADGSETATLPAGFAYTAAPIVSGVSPVSGDPVGGDLVTVIGENFATSGTVGVTFGGMDATGVSVQTSAVLTCFTPPGPPGAVTVQVTNPDMQLGALAGAFTYTTTPPDPTVSTVTPSVGDPLGGDLVTISGTGFDTVGPVTVAFAAIGASSITVVDPTRLTCLTPPAPVGPATVRVTNPGGGFGERVDGFIFTAAPVVMSVNPGSGDLAGGDPVTITGDNFDTLGVVTVLFGTAPAMGVAVPDTSTITCLTPPGASGPVTITVTNPDMRQGTLPNGFTYTTGPVVTGVTPGTGDVAGGDLVTVTGDNFATAGTVTVSFGLADALAATVVDSSTITCLTPPGPPGAVTVTVSNPDAREGALTGGFIYTAAPTVTAVSPSSGIPTGNDFVTILGTDFDTSGPMTVTFDLAPATGVVVSGPTTLTCFTPPGGPGPVTVEVTNPGGRQGALVDGFVFTPDPTVTGVVPPTGDEAGGDLVTVSGTDFDTVGTVTVKFGASDGGAVSVLDPTTLTCLTPPGTAGSVTVTVIHSNGQQGALAAAFTYLAPPPPPPTVLAVSPSSGGVVGGELVTVTGSDFDLIGPVTVTFGPGTASGVNVQDSGTLTCLTPPGSLGTVAVTVVNPDLQQGSLPGGYTYTGADPAVIAMEDQVLALINQERAGVGKAALAHDPAIRLVARAHSEDMRDRDFFDHVNPDGDDPADRLISAGISFSAWAENIHWNLGSFDPAQTAFDWWMNSPLHKSNMLDESSIGFTLTGIGCATDGAGKWWFTAIFVRA